MGLVLAADASDDDDNDDGDDDTDILPFSNFGSQTTMHNGIIL